MVWAFIFWNFTNKCIMCHPLWQSTCQTKIAYNMSHSTCQTVWHGHNYHHNNIVKLNVRWCVWKVGKGFPSRVWLKTLKWVAVYSSVTFHINGYHGDRSALCLYTLAGWGVMSCVCGMAFLCGSTLVKVPLLQSGTVVIWPQMFKINVKPQQHRVGLAQSVACPPLAR